MTAWKSLLKAAEAKHEAAEAARQRLEADAPELLAALAWALDQLEDSLDPDHQQALEAARALVARHREA